MLEFLLLQEDYPRALEDLDALPVETFGLPDKLHDFWVEIDIELFIGAYNQGRLQRSLAPINLINPNIIIPHFVNSKLLTQTIITSIILLNLSRGQHSLREHRDGRSNALEKVSTPDDLACVLGHIAD